MKKEIDSTNGQEFRALRQQFGLSLNQTAALLSRSKRTIQYWEDGTNYCHPSNIDLLKMYTKSTFS
jgi:DNA-binding transcriptional regulator YiaG